MVYCHVDAKDVNYLEAPSRSRITGYYALWNFLDRCRATWLVQEIAARKWYRARDLFYDGNENEYFNYYVDVKGLMGLMCYY